MAPKTRKTNSCIFERFLRLRCRGRTRGNLVDQLSVQWHKHPKGTYRLKDRSVGVWFEHGCIRIESRSNLSRCGRSRCRLDARTRDGLRGTVCSSRRRSRARSTRFTYSVFVERRNGLDKHTSLDLLSSTVWRSSGFCSWFGGRVG
jgi:hypothetical protein